MNLKYPKSKSGLALLGASGMIAAGAFVGTTVISHAATPTPSAQVTKAPAEAPDAAGTKTPEAAGTETPDAAGTEKPEANEPAIPGGGHNDTGANADHQFDGVE
jgi:hypothetical protein